MSIYQDKFILFGDSITQQNCSPELEFSLAGALQHDYIRKLDIVTRGYSGYNSDHARHMVKQIIEAENSGKAKVVLTSVFFGSNDSSSGVQNVPLDRFVENIKYIAHSLLDQGIKVIIVGTALHDEVESADPENDTRSMDANLAYNRAARQVAEELNVGFVDLFQAMLDSVGWKQGEPIPGKRGTPVSNVKISHLLPDGLHFSGEGYRVFYKALKAEIKMKYPELDSDNLRTLLPPWDMIGDDINGSLYGKNYFLMHE